MGLNSKCWKLEDSDNSVYFRRRAKWYQTKPNCLRMSSHFLRTKPVCQNRIYGRVENWTNLSPFMRYNVFICTFYCKCSFCLKDSRLVNFLRRCGASFPKLNQPKEIFSLMTLSVNILLSWHFCGQVFGITSWFPALCGSKFIIGEILTIYSRWFDINLIQNSSPYCSTNHRTLAFKVSKQNQFWRGNSISTKWKTCWVVQKWFSMVKMQIS